MSNAWTPTESELAFVAAFDAGVREDYEKSGVPYDQYRAGGRISKEWPNREDYGWWRANGPAMVERYRAWRDAVDLSLWIAPGGEPAIELAMTPVIGGVVVKMFVDRVFVTRDDQLVIVDIKTGSREPADDMQLGFYRVGLQKTFGVEVNLGAYWMARSGQLTPYADLKKYDERYLGELLQQFNRAVEGGVFLPHRTNLCNSCGVNRACFAFGGADAAKYDRLHPEFVEIKRKEDDV